MTLNDPISAADSKDNTTLKEAHKAVLAHDFDKAAKLLKPLAEKNFAEAQVEYGDLFFFGRGVTASKEEAAQWYRKAAEHGNARGQYKLGDLYDSGLGVEQSDTKAISWLTKASDGGDADAMYRLAGFYCAPKDAGGLGQPDKAIALYGKAADNGSYRAASDLAYMYMRGRGVKPDHAKAFKYYQRACELGDEYSVHMLCYMYYKGDGVPANTDKAIEVLARSRSQHDDLIAKKILAKIENHTLTGVDKVQAKNWMIHECMGTQKTAVGIWNHEIDKHLQGQ